MANRYGVNVSLSDAECEEIARKVGEAPKKVYRRDVKPGQVFRYQKDHDKAQRILAIDSTWWMYKWSRPYSLEPHADVYLTAKDGALQCGHPDFEVEIIHE